MNAFKPRETLTEQVARHIENLIAFEQLRSGERIYESAMARQMDVSHGSIREGLLLLEKRHLVRNVPRKGAFVTPLNEHFVRSLYETLELYLTHTGRKLVRQWQPDDMQQLESLYEQMCERSRKNDLMAFLELGIEYTKLHWRTPTTTLLCQRLRTFGRQPNVVRLLHSGMEANRYCKITSRTWKSPYRSSVTGMNRRWPISCTDMPFSNANRYFRPWRVNV